MAQSRPSSGSRPYKPVPHKLRTAAVLHPAGRVQSLHLTRSASLSLSTSSPGTSTPPTSSRAILGPLQPNHSPRRLIPNPLPTRMARDSALTASGIESGVKVGSKRKRIPSGIENGHGNGVLHGGGRIKRQRSSSTQFSSDEDGSSKPASEMEIDSSLQQHWPSPQDSEDEDSSDEYFINEAQARYLLRLRKDRLVRLYQSAGLADDPELLTKPEIVDAIIAARDDLVSLPPSSPPGRNGNDSSDCSSDDGGTVGDESPDRDDRANALRRRETVNDLGRALNRVPKGRSLSMGQISTHIASSSRRTPRTPVDSPVETNLRARSRFPGSPVASGSLPSPPITRRTTRRASATNSAASSHSASSTASKSKGKAKQVGFSEEVQVNGLVQPLSPASEDESDLTDLAELEEDVMADDTPRPPKRKPVSAENTQRRKTPARKAKGKIGSMREESDISEDQLEDELEEDMAEEEDDANTSDRDEEAREEEEVDELVSSPSPTPPPGSLTTRRTPLRKRLRPRRGQQILTPPSDGDDDDGDDEREGDDDDDEDDNDEEEEADELIADDENDELENDSEDETGVEVTPKKLRSGKIVGEDAEEGESDDDEDELEDDEDETIVDAEEAVEDDEVENDETMEEDVDLNVATSKTLVRLRRDELVRMCEARKLDIDGTKPQLVEALLHWRDQQASVPSSTATARPPSTARPPRGGRRKSSRNSGDSQRTPVPVLLRTHVHVEQPATPPVSSPGRAKEGVKETEDGELELDLAELGLDDREISPEKLTKLEKIGSGGFKDVYIGRFRGRKVAIAEFRGQLTAMDIKELKLLGEFNHPNIVRFLGVSIPENTKETPVMVISELCSNGDLFDYIRNVPAPKLTRVLSIMLDIAKGFEYLHTRKPSIIHRDCKSSNILITSKATAKIADFGLAKVKQSTRSMVRSLVGTVNWQAPELWHAHPKYNHKVDVFSCGVVFWEMLQWHIPNKKFPWEGMNEHAIYEAVGAKRQRPSTSGLRKQWCPEIVDLMERMWAHDHVDRPTMTEVVQELEAIHKHYR